MSAVDQYLASRSLQVASSNGGRPTFQTINQFNQTYWSGLDAAIYFDDLYIGEMVALHYEEQEAVYPLFGYADYVKRGSIHGQRRVMGQFTINFQQALMMYLILEHIRAGGGTLNKAESIIPVPKAGTPASAPKAQMQQAITMLAPEAVTRMSELSVATPTGNPVLSAGLTQIFNPGAMKMADVIKKVKQATLSTVASSADRLKKQFNWAQENPTPLTGPGASLLTAVQNSLAAQAFQSKYDTVNGFKIGIVLGETDLKQYQGTYRTPSSVLVPTDFDDAYFQAAAHVDSKDVASALQSLPPATVLTITDVDITGHGMTIDDSGRPLLQTYSFIGGDVTTSQ
jgi:hypothetical protein